MGLPNGKITPAGTFASPICGVIMSPHQFHIVQAQYDLQTVDCSHRHVGTDLLQPKFCVPLSQPKKNRINDHQHNSN